MVPERLSVEEVWREEGLGALVSQEGVDLLVDHLIGQWTQAPSFGSERRLARPMR